MSHRMSPLRVLVADDEAPAREELAWLLGRDPEVGEVRTAATGAEVLRSLDAHEVDALFLDIRMPGLDGLDVARVLARFKAPPKVVFVTAYDEHAVEAFDLRAVDYLLKPVRQDRLSETIGRLLAARAPVGAGPSGADATDGRIAVDLAGTTRFVLRSDVRWAEAQGDYARLHMVNGESHLLRTPLAVLQEQWAAFGFVRVHRGYLVALHLVVELRAAESGHRIRVSGGRTVADLPVSRRHLRELKDMLFTGRRPGR